MMKTIICRCLYIYIYIYVLMTCDKWSDNFHRNESLTGFRNDLIYRRNPTTIANSLETSLRSYYLRAHHIIFILLFNSSWVHDCTNCPNITYILYTQFGRNVSMPIAGVCNGWWWRYVTTVRCCYLYYLVSDLWCQWTST